MSPGETLRLRPVEPRDHDRFTGWLVDPRLRDATGDIVYPEPEWARILASRFSFIVETARGVVGSVALEGDWKAERPGVELAVMIDPVWQGQGFGTQAVRLALGRAFDELGAEHVWHGVYADNEPVLRFFRRFGFAEDRSEGWSGPSGEAAVHFSMSAADWHGQ